MSNESTDVAKRPTFLTVLCILTFVGSGLGIIGGVWNYFSFKSLESSPAGGLVLAFYKDLGLDISKLATGYLISGIASILTLVGALQMWKLKKMGFYLYCVGSLVALVSSFMFMGGFALGGFAAIGIIITTAFIVMYALQLKSLK